MSKYINKWSDGQMIVVSETHPGEYFYPLVAMSRVQGENYQPYTPKDGGEAWVKAANKALASHARANFEKRQPR